MAEPTPEYEAVRLASVSVYDGAAADALLKLTSTPLDWELVYYEAVYHGVQPVVYARLRGLDRASDTMFAEVMRVLQGNVSARTAYSLFLSTEMARISRVLGEASVPYLVLKGPSLSEAYGGVAFRPFVDNDILVARRDFHRAEEALRTVGFERRDRTPLRLAGYLYIHGEFSFSRRVTGQISTVDMHTALVPPGLSYQERLGALLGRGRFIPVAGQDVPVLGWEDLLITLCVNGFKDQWYRLRLVSDVSAVAAMVADWDVVFRRAEAARSRRMVYTALLLAVGESGLTLPAPVHDRIWADAPSVRLAERTRVQLRSSRTTGLLPWGDRVYLNLRSQDSLLGQARYTAFSALRHLTEGFVDPEQGTVRRSRSHPDA